MNIVQLTPVEYEYILTFLFLFIVGFFGMFVFRADEAIPC